MVQLLVLGAGMVAVVVIETVFPYDKAQVQAKRGEVWRRAARIVIATIALYAATWAWVPHRK